MYYLCFCFLFRYADHAYRTHPRGLIIYGPATASSYSGVSNVSASTTIQSVVPAARTSNNATRQVDTSAPSKILGGTGGTTNVTELPVLQRCPLIPPNLGESFRHPC